MGPSGRRAHPVLPLGVIVRFDGTRDNHPEIADIRRRT
jgi:hypothetical protein